MSRISAVTFHYILKAIEQRSHVPMAELLAHGGIDPALFERENAQIDSSRLSVIFAHAVAVTGDEHLSLHIGESVPYQSLGLLGYLLVHTRSVGEMLERFHRFQKLVGRRLKFHLEAQDGGYKLAIYIKGNPLIPVPRFHAEVHLSALMNIIRQICGWQLVPERVCFAHEAPEEPQEYLRIFGPNVRFGAEENAIYLGSGALQMPIATSNPSMLRFFESQAQQILDDLEDSSWYARVKHVILRHLGEEDVTIEFVASKLGIGPRTLQSRLKEESQSYRGALNAVRRQLAEHYILHTRMDFASIALFLGYSDPTAFFRAYRSWNGTTPSRHRHSGIARGHAPGSNPACLSPHPPL